MKKTAKMIINSALVLIPIVICIFLVMKAEGNKLVLTFQLICSFAILFFGLKGVGVMMDQFDDNKQKLTGKKLLLFDAILVIIGVMLFVSKMIENYRGYDAVGARFHSYINNCAGLYYVIVLIMAIICTFGVVRGAFKPHYSLEKKKITVDGKDVSVDAFVKTNYKGEILQVELESEVSGRRIAVKGSDENEAMKKFSAML